MRIKVILSWQPIKLLEKYAAFMRNISCSLTNKIADILYVDDKVKIL